jgi:hypothetical protein
MRIYRFRVLIDDPGEAFRDIEIAGDQTFLDLHKAIKDAFAFVGQEMACFYVSDQEWNKGTEIPLADLGFSEEEGPTPTLMNEVLISDHIRGTDQRFIYAYDFLHMWMFLVELIHAAPPETGVQYPRVVMSMGMAPDEHSREQDLSAGILEEEDPYATGDEEYGTDDEEEDGAGQEDDDEGFGHGSIEDLGDEYR